MGNDLYRTRRVDTVRAFMPVDALSDLVSGVRGSFENEIRRLSYLGPLRSYPSRRLVYSQHDDPNRYAGGGYAWDVVRDNPEVIEIPVTPEGEFERTWPGGFFTERAEELF